MAQWIKKVAIALVMLMGTLRADDHLVNTPSGPILGITMKGFTEKEVDVFYGIPYAEPPVGTLRFGPPVEVKSWQGVHNATAPSLACYQQSVPAFEEGEFAEYIPKKPYTEDCLKLHIWVPKTKRANSTVMVYIHGGGFILGHPLTLGLEGATLAAEENIIVVSMNYRLTAHGFLYLGIPEAPGNMGLMDQQMALKWIRRNIGSFGGNPNDVTIFGMSAGGASVGFQLLSPGSRDLFKRAILMSGTPNAVWSIRTKEGALDTSMKLAKSVGCGSGNAQEVLRCLHSLKAENLSEWNSEQFSLSDLQFVPTVDGTFITDYPMALLGKKNVKSTDVMIGNTADESSFFMNEALPDIHLDEKGEITEEQFFAAADSAFYRNKDYNKLAREVIPLLYTDWTRPEDLTMWRDALKDLLSDYQFNCAANDFADLYSTTKSTVYRYVVDHHFKSLPFPKWMGTPHGSDTFLHLGMAAGGGKDITYDEMILSKRVMRWFANFARTGYPSAMGESGPSWDQSTLTEKEYMRIAVRPSTEKHFRTQKCSMIKNIMAIIEENCHK